VFFRRFPEICQGKTHRTAGAQFRDRWRIKTAAAHFRLFKSSTMMAASIFDAGTPCPDKTWTTSSIWAFARGFGNDRLLVGHVKFFPDEGFVIQHGAHNNLIYNFLPKFPGSRRLPLK